MGTTFYTIGLLMLLASCQPSGYVRREAVKACAHCEPPTGPSQLSSENTPATLMGSVDGYYDYMTDRGIRIRDVRLTPQYTVLYMQFTNKGRPVRNDDGKQIWVNYIHVNSQTALTTTTGRRFKLVKAEGVSIWPKLLKVHSVDQVNFVLYFERLNQGATQFNWEGCQDTERLICWRFYNVKVDNPATSRLITVNQRMPLSEYVEANSSAATDNQIVPLQIGSKITLRNIHFEVTSAVILPDSFAELDRLLGLMQANPQLMIRLEGHTDTIGNHAKNYQLAMDRVRACQHYLTMRGVTINRIHLVSLGDTKPLVAKGSDEQRKANRRVECVIVNL